MIRNFNLHKNIHFKSKRILFLPNQGSESYFITI